MYRTFRPRLARRVAFGLAIILIIAMIVLFIVVPTEGPFSFDVIDYIAGVCFVSIFLWILYMHYNVHVSVDDNGLMVKNLIYSHAYSWNEVLGVEFGSGPWARIDTSDGRSTPIMAIQSSDGEFARKEAVRLASLIEMHSVEDPEH